MIRTLTIDSDASPGEILRSLERLERSWSTIQVPGRLKPPSSDGITFQNRPPQFTLAYRKTGREWSHPICVGRVESLNSGSVIRATIRYSRGRLIVPLIWFVLLAIAWVRGTLDVFSSVVIVLMLSAGLGIGMLTVLFSSPAHEAEADALEAVLRAVANRDSAIAAA